MNIFRRMTTEVHRSRSWRRGTAQAYSWRGTNLHWLGHTCPKSWRFGFSKPFMRMAGGLRQRYEEVPACRTVTATGGMLTQTALGQACKCLELDKCTPSVVALAPALYLGASSMYGWELEVEGSQEEAGDWQYVFPEDLQTYTVENGGRSYTEIIPERHLGFCLGADLPDEGVLVISQEGPCARVRVVEEI